MAISNGPHVNKETLCVFAMNINGILHIARVPPRGGYTNGTQETHTRRISNE